MTRFPTNVTETPKQMSQCIKLVSNYLFKWSTYFTPFDKICTFESIMEGVSTRSSSHLTEKLNCSVGNHVCLRGVIVWSVAILYWNTFEEP